MTIFPLVPDQTIAQMWSNGVRGGHMISPVVSELSVCTYCITSVAVCSACWLTQF